MKRILLHLFGAIASLVFAVGSASLVEGNSTIATPSWCWAIVTAIGFIGLLWYVRLYRR